MTSPISLDKFLSQVPPNSDAEAEVTIVDDKTYQGRVLLKLPTIMLHCASESCGRIQYFSPDDSAVRVTLGIPSQHYWRFTCKNCEQTIKVYAVIIEAKTRNLASIYKVGEIPPYGSPTPPRLLSLLGNEKEYYLKGRRSENQSLGIGAFAYYRRVVENQKSRIFDEIIKVAKLTNAPHDLIESLERAAKETQFTKAVESLKGAIPDSIRIDGHNPLTLLHDALSEGLHSNSDEECLDRAETIRIVLSSLTERMAELSKDNAELKSALTRLLSRKKK